MGYSCDNEHGAAAVVLITNLENGDVQALCRDCFPGWAAVVVQAFREAGAYGPEGSPEVNGVAAGEGEPAPDPAPRKRARKRAEKPPPELTSQASPFPDPTPVE